MFQFPGQGKPAQGVLFDSDFGRTIDSVLALALLHGLENKRDARIAALSISGGGLKAAQLCDVIEKFYASATTGLAAQFFQGTPIGLAGSGRENTIFAAVLEKNPSRIANINDTAEPAVVLRNVLTAQYDQNAVVVLAGPATNLVALLDMNGGKELIAQKVKSLTLAEPPLAADIPAAKRLLAEWPTPIAAVRNDAVNGVMFPASSIEKDFAYNANHPVAAAYRAFQAMPYDAGTLDMAAVLYAVRPKADYFRLSEPGTLTIGNDGHTNFLAGGGKKHRYLIQDPAQNEKIVALYTELASAKPVPRAFRRPVQDDNADEKKDEKPVVSKQK
jgi:hypothetical protein